MNGIATPSVRAEAQCWRTTVFTWGLGRLTTACLTASRPPPTQAFSPSVGYAELERFLRPEALQDAPAWLIDDKWQS